MRWWSLVGVVGLAEMPRNPSHVSRPGNGRPDGPAVSKGGLAIRLPVGLRVVPSASYPYLRSPVFFLFARLPPFIPTYPEKPTPFRPRDRQTDRPPQRTRAQRTTNHLGAFEHWPGVSESFSEILIPPSQNQNP